MESFNGQVEGGRIVAIYQREGFRVTCKALNGYYFVTFHNGRQTNVTRYSQNKDEMNAYVVKEFIRDGFRRVY